MVPELAPEAWDSVGLDIPAVPMVLEEVQLQHKVAVQTITGLVS
jgi:hypothetical protein